MLDDRSIHEESRLNNSWPDQEHSPGDRVMCVRVTNQEKTSPQKIQRAHHKRENIH